MGPKRLRERGPRAPPFRATWPARRCPPAYRLEGTSSCLRIFFLTAASPRGYPPITVFPPRFAPSRNSPAGTAPGGWHAPGLASCAPFSPSTSPAWTRQVRPTPFRRASSPAQDRPRPRIPYLYSGPGNRRPPMAAGPAAGCPAMLAAPRHCRRSHRAACHQTSSAASMPKKKKKKKKQKFRPGIRPTLRHCGAQVGWP